MLRRDGVEDGLGNSSLLLFVEFWMRFWFLDVGYLGWIQVDGLNVPDTY